MLLQVEPFRVVQGDASSFEWELHDFLHDAREPFGLS